MGIIAQKQKYIGEQFISIIQGMVDTIKRSANKFGRPVIGNQPSSCAMHRSNPHRPSVCSTSSLHYDAYYDDGYDSYDDISISDIMTIQAQTDWRSPCQVFNFDIHGLDLSEVPNHQVDKLFDYCNSVSSNVQPGNINFNKDCSCAVCGQMGHSFDE